MSRGFLAPAQPTHSAAARASVSTSVALVPFEQLYRLDMLVEQGNWRAGAAQARQTTCRFSLAVVSRPRGSPIADGFVQMRLCPIARRHLAAKSEVASESQ